MRFLHLIKGDFSFQRKYGIWLVYLVFSVVYIATLHLLPVNAAAVVGPIMVYSDPAAMGLFFMGAIVLLEKSQRVNCSLAVSPVTIDEYILSKVLSLMMTGTIVGVVILTLGGVNATIWTIPGVAFSSILFSLCGLFVASKVSSLNYFAIVTVPFELVIMLPAILYFFGYFQSEWFICHPGIAAIRLITETGSLNVLCLISVIIWDVFVYLLCRKATVKYFRQMGGGTL